MQANRIHINEFLNGSKDHLLLDVRSPAEYAHAHMPGAISLPLFSDEERKLVGTAYKQESREKAIKIGLDFFGPKMRRIVEEVEGLVQQQKNISTQDNPAPPAHSTIYTYCWRGGMRSGAVSWLLNLYGFKVFILAGGYKAFRRWSIDTLSYPFPLKILGGYTGSGKTRVLQELKNKGERVVDLEDLAMHKGSAYGKIGKQQPSQEMFENLLALAFAENYKLPKEEHLKANGGGAEGEKSIWVEDESQRIGTVNIPGSVWNNMRNSPLYFLEIPFEERLGYLVEEYGSTPVESLKLATKRISKRLGGLETKNVLSFLQEENFKEAFRILLLYYDKRYLKGLHNRNEALSFIQNVECEKVNPLNAHFLLNQYQTL